MIPADAASDDVAAFFLWHHRDGRRISVYLIDGCCINGRDGSEWPEPTTGGGKWPPQSGCRSRWRPDNAMVNNPAPPVCSRFPSRAALDLLAVAIAAATGIDQSSGTTRRRDNTGPLLRLHPTTLLNGRIIAPPPPTSVRRRPFRHAPTRPSGDRWTWFIRPTKNKETAKYKSRF